MTLFYAYLKYRGDDVRWRYLITFVDRHVADEWWRAVSVPPSPYAGNIKRVSSQFYTQDVAKNNVIDFFDHILDGKLFLEKMFFTLLHDRGGRILTLIPPTANKFADHISGKWYFVGSQADVRKYWYFRVDGVCLVCGDANCNNIHVSTEYRTKFQIQARLKSESVSDDFVMIGRDEVSIAASKDYVLRINEEENLKATKTQDLNPYLLFGDLKDRFATRARTAAEGGGKVWEVVVPVEKGLGEAWELFD